MGLTFSLLIHYEKDEKWQVFLEKSLYILILTSDYASYEWVGKKIGEQFHAYLQKTCPEEQTEDTIENIHTPV